MTFLSEPPTTPEVQALYDADVAGRGYVMNLSRTWAHHPEAHDVLFDLLRDVAARGGLTMRERAVLVTACASTMGDPYCSLAWGTKLAEEATDAAAASVLAGGDGGLTDAERALATWARQVATDPNATTEADVQRLRDAGYSDGQVFAITAFTALRLAFSTINDALGAVPDTELSEAAPPAVRDAVTWGRS
ncbi:carboxymuconolactone decarboxylase family protein [Nocardioides sp.]|uniref:carboxymuconolactone decarboxylase family protein n=1 Tax=Nocardioides sp. TaxID=35761 RepID=UPI003783FB4D